MTPLRKPSALRAGDVVGVVAPAGIVSSEDLDAGTRRLEALGYRVRRGRSVHGSVRYLAGRDQDRAADLMDMFDDPAVRVIVAARGGYGTSRILPLLDPAKIGRSPKIVVGSSDVTVLLHFLATACRMVTFHGPMVAPNFGRRASPATDQGFTRMVSADAAPLVVAASGVRSLRAGAAEGVLTGGCLSLVCQTIGTPYEIQTDGAILFLEDIGEAPYRIDRMLTYLRQVGKFENVSAVIFGVMPGCHPAPGSDYTLSDVIEDVLGDLPCPILLDFPSGHGDTSLTLPFGVRAAVDGPALRILEAPVC